MRTILAGLLRRIVVSAERIELVLDRQHLLEALTPTEVPTSTRPRQADDNRSAPLTLTIEARLRRTGREMKLVVDNGDRPTQPDPALLRVLAQAHDIYQRLTRDPALTVPEIARRDQIATTYVSRLLRLPTLAPDIVTALVNGTQPPELTAKKLMRLAPELPVDWSEQRQRLGFRQ